VIKAPTRLVEDVYARHPNVVEEQLGDVMNALLAWSLRFIENLAPDITTAVREGQRLADRYRPGRGRIGHNRSETPARLPQTGGS
jgi:hypothetical protein